MEAVVLVPGEAILFIRRCSLKEGFLYHNTQDIELGWRGPVNWVRRSAQLEATTNKKVAKLLWMPSWRRK